MHLKQSIQLQLFGTIHQILNADPGLIITMSAIFVIVGKNTDQTSY